jgi:AcrR family transcriptional regulator
MTLHDVAPSPRRKRFYRLNKTILEGPRSVPDAAPEAKKPRKASREARKAQLIEATIEVIAESGYARTTLTDVAKKAGLSHGLVNFHFSTKEGLLSETLAYLAEEYRDNWGRALAMVPDDDAARQIEALLKADFEPALCTPARLSAWCSFWGEAQSRPIYQQNYGANDERYNRMLEGICARLIAKGGYAGDPVIVARALRVTVEGVWLDLMTMDAPYSREEGLRTVMSTAAAYFPRHFNDEGLKA